jgi:hypothetical protein
MRGLWFLVVVLLVGWLVLLAGCGAPVEARPSQPTEAGAAGSSTTASTGGEGGGCAGKCWESSPDFFEEVSMYWIGPPDEAPDPPCPDFAPHVGFTGYTDLQAPHTCPVCSCSPAECALPEEMHVFAAPCPGDGAPSLVWDSPAWLGECTAEGAIPPGLMCGGEPCAQSLMIDASTVVAPCQAHAQGDEFKPPPTWGLMARECKIAPLTGEGCPNLGEACIPPLPEGYTLCVHRDGHDPAFACDEPYPRRVEVFANYQDNRACEPCACSAADCSALVTAFSDGACGVQIASATVALGDPQCVDLPAGVGLGSKAATWMAQTPGSCTGTGGPVGAAVGVGPITLCCLPEPAPVP